MERVRTAVVGAGGIFHGWGGDSGHLPAFAWVAESQLAGICDPDRCAREKALNATQLLFGAEAVKRDEAGDKRRADELREDAAQLRAYACLEALLSEAAPELVDVIAPAGFHAQICCEALRAGAHIMCEKPMARTWIEAAGMVETVAQSGRLFQYSENLMFADPWPLVRNCIEAGAIGETLLLYLPLAIGGPGNASYMRDGVGALLDMAIHAITLSWFLLGFDKTPVRVRAVDPFGIAVRMPSRQDNGVHLPMTVEDDAHVLIEFEDDARGAWCNAHVEGSWSHRDSPETKVLGTTGSLTVEGATVRAHDAFGGSRTLTPFHPQFKNVCPPPGYGGYAQQLRNMCHCIRHGTRPQCDERIAAESMAIAGAAYLSEMRGRVAVALDEFKAYAEQLVAAHGDKASDALLDACLGSVDRRG